MKKTLIALSVLVAAGSVNAAEIYNKDGNTFDFGGAIEAQYKKSTTPDADPKLQIDDAEFYFDLKRQVNDNVKVLGYWKFDGIDGNAKVGENNENSVLGNAYAGFETNFGTFTFGIQDTVMDGAGVGNDFEFGPASKVEDANFNYDNVAMYAYDKGMFFLSAATVIDGDEKTDFVDGKIGFRPVEGLEVRLFALDATTQKGQADEKEVATYALQGQYVFGNFDIEASYAAGDASVKNVDNGKKVDTKILAIAGAYNMGDYQFNLGASQTDNEDLKDSYNEYFANVKYAVAANSTVYFEVGSNTGYYDTVTKAQADKGANTKDFDIGYVAGIQVTF